MRSRVTAGGMALVEVLARIEKEPYHWPMGGILFRKLAYFVTLGSTRAFSRLADRLRIRNLVIALWPEALPNLGIDTICCVVRTKMVVDIIAMRQKSWLVLLGNTQV